MSPKKKDTQKMNWALEPTAATVDFTEVPANAPEILAGPIVAKLMDGELTRAQADAALAPLGYLFCRTCFAYLEEHTHGAAQ
jgi:hypothetical protein